MARVIIEFKKFPRHLTGTVDGYLKALSEARENLKKKLIVKNKVKINPMPHQLNVAHKVIYEMDTRAILADEVGLGKTIEAGLILKEKALRGEIDSALILTPSSLALQWEKELLEKFSLNFKVAYRSEDFEYEWIIASLSRAKREPYRGITLSRRWDIVIVDEAHHIKNPHTQNYKLIRAIDSKYLLLLTATPINNSLKEIYYLGDLVRPGIFGTYREFESRYFLDKKGLKITNRLELQRKLEDIMIRNRRADVFVDFTERVVKTYIARQSFRERELYRSLHDFFRASGNRLRVIAYERAATSSPRTVAKMAWKALNNERDLRIRDALLKVYRYAMEAESSKIKALIKAIENIGKCVVFTSYIETQKEIVRALEKNGLKTVIFNGTLNYEKKRETIEEFKKDADVLVATDSGGEGLNLQFVNFMINYDLPWNPMRVEQRIGRIHRIGQWRDVYIVNLIYQDTVEEYIYTLLHQKIDLFKSVVGEIDAILGTFERNLDAIIAEIILNSQNEQELKERIANLGESLREMKEEFERVQGINDEILGVFDLGVREYE